MSFPWDRETCPKEGQPFGWVQWKGTDVCMDFHCECGCFAHVDGQFAYNVQCPECEAVYAMSGFVEAIRLTAEEAAEVLKEDLCIVRAEEFDEMDVALRCPSLPFAGGKFHVIPGSRGQWLIVSNPPGPLPYSIADWRKAILATCEQREIAVGLAKALEGVEVTQP